MPMVEDFFAASHDQVFDEIMWFQHQSEIQ